MARTATAAKPAKTKKTSAAKPETNGHKPRPVVLDDPNMVAGVTKVVDIKLVDVSPFEAQKRRRAHFKTEDLDELGRSIASTKGFIHAPVVREIKGRYQIVAGERRYLAAKGIGYKTVEVKVADLNDEQVRAMQLVENLQRKDAHPVDEGFDYQDLMKLKEWSVDELALQIGKTHDYILNRLKLTGLIEPVRKDVDSGLLPLSHALEIAKFADPTTQKAIHEHCYRRIWDAGKDVLLPLPLKSLLGYINNSILLKLTKAPFDIKSKALRKDGLTCPDCPERTGAAPGLFADYKADKADHCLNPTCFQTKIDKSFEIKRAEIAVDAGVTADKVPLVDFSSYSQGRGVLGYYEVTKETHENAGKKGVLVGISVNQQNYGKPVYFRMKPKERSSSSSSTSSRSTGREKTAKEKADFYNRKEEIWNVKIGEAVRRRVFALAGLGFAKTFSVKGAGDTFVPALYAKLLELYYSYYTNRRVRDLATHIVASHLDMDHLDVTGEYNDDGAGSEKKIAKLSDEVQRLLLYALLHGHKGDMGSGSYVSQKAVREIAVEWKVDYTLIDAKVRAEMSPKKHQKPHDEYLKAVESGQKNPKVPRLYSETWKPND